MYKYVDDYLPELEKQFPELSRKDIKRCVEWGWRIFYYFTLFGCDVVLNTRKAWLYCGNLTYDSIKHFCYYKKKLCRRIRALFIRKRKQWDGYYYTGLNEDEYEYYMKRKNRAKYFTFHNKSAYKLLDEAKLKYSHRLHIIKFKYIIDMGYSFYKDKLKCTDVSIAFEREHPAKFNDILVWNNKYSAL